MPKQIHYLMFLIRWAVLLSVCLCFLRVTLKSVHFKIELRDFHLTQAQCRQDRGASAAHRRGPKTVLAQTAEITKSRVIFVVFFKF